MFKLSNIIILLLVTYNILLFAGVFQLPFSQNNKHTGIDLTCSSQMNTTDTREAVKNSTSHVAQKISLTEVNNLASKMKTTAVVEETKKNNVKVASSPQITPDQLEGYFHDDEKVFEMLRDKKDPSFREAIVNVHESNDVTDESYQLESSLHTELSQLVANGVISRYKVTCTAVGCEVIGHAQGDVELFMISDIVEQFTSNRSTGYANRNDDGTYVEYTLVEF